MGKDDREVSAIGHDQRGQEIELRKSEQDGVEGGAGREVHGAEATGVTLRLHGKLEGRGETLRVMLRFLLWTTRHYK